MGFYNIIGLKRSRIADIGGINAPGKDDNNKYQTILNMKHRTIIEYYMKKTIILLLISSILIISLIFFFFFISWQIILIPDIGTFKVPRDWIVTKKENLIIITDRSIEEEGYNIYLIEISSINDSDDKYYYKFLENIKYIENYESVIFSNSASYWKVLLHINENIEEKYAIGFINISGTCPYLNKSIDFLVWDNLLDEKTIIKIAKTFKTCSL